jgi:hypothetical protein
MIFPEIREAYNAKIKNPMDLTTAEAKLLSGVYVYAEEVSAGNLDVTYTPASASHFVLHLLVCIRHWVDILERFDIQQGGL